jgi:Fur family transcriptional regulator, ferric uptake regulator
MALKPIARDSDADAIQIIEPLCAVFRRHLKSIGQKYTPERAQVLDSLFRLDDLFEAEQLQAALTREGRRVSKATIYRTIKLLLDAGIIQKVFVDSDQAHFQLAYGRKPHELLLRMDTKEIIQIDLPELAPLRDRVCRERGLKATGHRLIIYATRA